MIPLKDREQQQLMREGGQKLALVLEAVLKEIKPGMSLKQLDQLAEKLIKLQGGTPSFKMVKGYSWASCLNLNQGVVHGIPDETKAKKGDLLSLDLGFFFKGLHTDMARSLWLGVADNGFLAAGKRALAAAKLVALPGRRVGDLSLAIETEIKKAGFTPVRSLTGHGIGRSLHEEPPIPCFLKGKAAQTKILATGMSLAIEVIYAQGKPDLILEDDGWTLQTKDGGLAGLFEDTILITNQGAETITPLELKLTV